MLFDGRNGGTVELLENVLVIRRKGLGSFLTQGLKGEKRVPYASIRSVQFKEAGFTTGYIQFGIAGGIESRGGVWDATTDENTVLFTKEAANDFRQLRDVVEDRVANAGNRNSSSSAPVAPSANVSEELGRLADLRDRGVLTDDELKEQKARLLGSATSREARNVRPAPSAVNDLRRRASAQPVQPPPPNMGRVVGFCCVAVLLLLLLFH